MSYKSYSSEGIVLARRNYGEADRILSVYTRAHGRQSLLARGVRRPKSRKRGSLEVFSHIKFSAVSTRGIDVITEAETIDDYKEVRENLRRVAVGYFLVETIGRITRENEKSEELFDLIVKYFNELCDPSSLRDLRRAFTYDVLVLVGFWPKDKLMARPDEVLEEVLERKLGSLRVGKKLQE